MPEMTPWDASFKGTQDRTRKRPEEYRREQEELPTERLRRPYSDRQEEDEEHEGFTGHRRRKRDDAM